MEKLEKIREQDKNRETPSFHDIYKKREGNNNASADKLTSIKYLNNEYSLWLDEEFLWKKTVVACGDQITQDSISLQAVNWEIHIKYMDPRYSNFWWYNKVRVIIRENMADQIVYDDKSDNILFRNTLNKQTNEKIKANKKFDDLFKKVWEGLEYTDPVDGARIRITVIQKDWKKKEDSGKTFYNIWTESQTIRINIILPSYNSQKNKEWYVSLTKDSEGFYYVDSEEYHSKEWWYWKHSWRYLDNIKDVISELDFFYTIIHDAEGVQIKKDKSESKEKQQKDAWRLCSEL